MAIGLLLMFGGFLAFATYTPPSIFQTDIETVAAANQAAFARTAVLTFVGFFLTAIGGYALRFGMIRPVAGYVATEASPALTMASAAVSRGISEGMAGTGGFPVRVEGAGAIPGRTEIRVKCRNCGFLETEDAEYCSKCGQRV